MDTRTKIVKASEIEERLKGQPACWITGNFDPLMAEHVQLLTQAAIPGQVLVVEVADSDRPLLSQRARAELVAALSMVDYVVLGNGAGKIQQDSGYSDRFVKHVLQRHAG